MGTKRLGNNLRLEIESATPGTYNEIAGQQNLSVNRQAQTIDTTTKDEFPYGSSAPGARSISLPATFIPSLPDANGYDRLVSLANDTDPFKIRIVDTANADEVVFRCSVYVTDRGNSLDANAPGGASCTFVNASAPEVDTL
jgi:predicted secreted protein